MPRPRRKPFWRWTPLPWVVVVLLMLATGTAQDVGAASAFRVLLAVTIAAAVASAIYVATDARRRGPQFTAEGQLRSLEGLELVPVAGTGHPITVADARRDQHGIEAARARGGERLPAVLVPDAGNWWNLRSDIAVYLVVDGVAYRAGRLGDQAQVAWQQRLDELKASGRYAVVEAEIVGTARPFAVDVRLEGARV
ncbi:hypothetical protein [Gryllotalpicola ginsengisoli]|uniref:hypothetical protein n=1 Tax=Gryllotalpicola ginsengisoli TaxID=444608 RepID=UPI0003B583B4|nr:hypothetical protein [Gryllotalpicola ginsengisoli]